MLWSLKPLKSCLLNITALIRTKATRKNLFAGFCLILEAASSGFSLFVITTQGSSLEGILQSSFYEKVVRKYIANLQVIPMLKCDFNKVATKPYWNYTTPCVFSCKYATYFWDTTSGRLAFNRNNLTITLNYKKNEIVKLLLKYNTEPWNCNTSFIIVSWLNIILFTWFKRQAVYIQILIFKSVSWKKLLSLINKTKT